MKFLLLRGLSCSCATPSWTFSCSCRPRTTPRIYVRKCWLAWRHSHSCLQSPFSHRRCSCCRWGGVRRWVLEHRFSLICESPRVCLFHYCAHLPILPSRWFPLSGRSSCGRVDSCRLRSLGLHRRSCRGRGRMQLPLMKIWDFLLAAPTERNAPFRCSPRRCQVVEGCVRVGFSFGRSLRWSFTAKPFELF